MKLHFFFLAVLPVVASPAPAATGHVHGAAALEVAVDGDRLSLEFSSPLDNLVGFERAPRTDKEKEMARRVKEQLQKPELLFVPTAAAGCVRETAQVDAPVLEGGKPDKGGHATLSATFSFKCRSAQALSSLEVNAFDSFSRLTRIDVQVAGARKQSAARLTPKNRRITW